MPNEQTLQHSVSGLMSWSHCVKELVVACALERVMVRLSSLALHVSSVRW